MFATHYLQLVFISHKPIISFTIVNWKQLSFLCISTMFGSVENLSAQHNIFNIFKIS